MVVVGLGNSLGRHEVMQKTFTLLSEPQNKYLLLPIRKRTSVETTRIVIDVIFVGVVLTFLM